MVKNMLKELVAVYVTSAIFYIDHCTAGAGTWFSTSNEYISAGINSDYEVASDTAGMCAHLCYNDERCATFHYNETSKICHFSEGRISGGTIFGPRIGLQLCPLNNNFRLYIRKKTILCLKHYPGLRVNYTEATKVCNNEGSHLLLIKSESMFQFVDDIASTEFLGPLWIDGTDENIDGNFTTLKGDPLPYIPPGTLLEKDKRFLCMRMNFPEFKQRSCRELKYFLCQIDV